jgi:hypothetical protein
MRRRVRISWKGVSVRIIRRKKNGRKRRSGIRRERIRN